MSEAILREGALHGAMSRHVSSPGGGLRLTEHGHLGYVNLRGDAADSSFVEAARAVLGLELPRTPNTAAEGGTHTAYWLGPDEWLVVTAPMAERGTANALRTALAARTTATMASAIRPVRSPTMRVRAVVTVVPRVVSSAARRLRDPGGSLVPRGGSRSVTRRPDRSAAASRSGFAR